MYILGVWDGHDSGAALLEDDRIVFAANEERYTKRKLEVRFPDNSIRACLGHVGIEPKEVEIVAFPTTEFTKTLSRIFPMQKEVYYRFRRRKMLRPKTEGLMHYTKYAMTGIGVLPLTKSISRTAVRRELGRLGFEDYRLCDIDHHAAHAATAAFTSGQKRSLVITIDGLGDGLSATISTFSKNRLRREKGISASNSIGIFYEQVTNIVGMRELEDEGKVMAMADYSYPFKFEENKLKDLFKTEGTEIIARHGFVRQYELLSRIAWSMPREQFAYMAQQLLERILTRFVDNAIEEFGVQDVVLSGGVVSNVKANMRIRGLERLKSIYVFPHMGDGGIALGAAMYANYTENGVASYSFGDVYLGDGYSEDRIRDALKREKGLVYELDKGKAGHAADLISGDEYIFWFNGRMEYGPRALGNRSILADASSQDVKERLNLYVKQREWYQPFAPTILEEDASKLLNDLKGHDRFMTSAYRIRQDKRDFMRSVIHVDMTARPQILGKENKEYRRVIERVKKLSGHGLVLNTSFNIHGMPIVLSPEDAIHTMKKTKTRYMFLDNYFVENKDALG